MRQNRLDFVDVDLLGELLLDGRRTSRDPDLELRIKIEGSCRLDGKLRNRAVRHAAIFDFPARQPLFVDEQQTPIGEQECVADQLIRRVNLLTVSEQTRVLLMRRRWIDLSSVADQTIHETHQVYYLHICSRCLPN